MRVAFLVEQGQNWGLTLEGIFAECYSRWGGRFSLIIPCVDHQVPASYWPWLQAYDPDIVYSYVTLSDADITEVHERLGPSRYLPHQVGPNPRMDVYGFKPGYGVDAPLSSLSTLFMRARYFRHPGGGAATQILEHYHGEPESLFISDNFGTYLRSTNTGIYPADAADVGALLTIVRDELKDGRHGVPADKPSVPNDLMAFRAIADGQAISMSLASMLFAPRLDFNHGRWSEAFSLVVGDTYADRILFWNSRLLLPSYLDRDLCCLRVSLEQLRDPAFRTILRDMLRHRNPVTDGRGGQSNVSIRSTSLTDAQFDEVRGVIAGLELWGPVSTTRVASLDELAPAQNALNHARMSNGINQGPFAQSMWRGFKWSMPTAVPPVATPPHLLDAPPRQGFTLGPWANDVTLDHDGPGARLGIGRPYELPRRWRMAGAFKASLSEQNHSRFLGPRSNRHGHLVVYSSVDRRIEEIKVPTTIAALEHALITDGLPAGMPPGERGYPPRKLDWLRPSNEGRYLSGVLGLTGGILKARRLLLHPFLRKMFARMGGSPELPMGMVQAAEQRVRRLARNAAVFNLEEDQDRRALAGMIVHAARGVSRPREAVQYDALADEWRTDRQEFWDQHPTPNADPDVDWDKEEALSLDRCLQELRHRELIYQGYRWVCPRCHHRNWLNVGDLAPGMKCAVCKNETQLPVHFSWMFKPNDFLIESLRDHSVLSLVWTLSALREESRSSFMFVGPMWMGFGGNDGEDPSGESDLLVIRDGKTIFCEVKSSWRGLSIRGLDQFVEVAERLRPDIALLAVMEPGREMGEHLDKAQQRLLRAGINFELLNTDRYQVDFDPFLDIVEESD